jgi:hypothetical protein
MPTAGQMASVQPCTMPCTLQLNQPLPRLAGIGDQEAAR